MTMKQFPEALVPSVPCQLEIPTKEGARLLSFRISFDFNAFALAEEKLGVSLLTPAIFGKMNATAASVLFWAGCQKDNSDYEGDEGLAAIRSYLTPANMAPALAAVNEAYIAVMPEAAREWLKKRAKELEADISPKENAAPVAVAQENPQS